MACPMSSTSSWQEPDSKPDLFLLDLCFSPLKVPLLQERGKVTNDKEKRETKLNQIEFRLTTLPNHLLSHNVLNFVGLYSTHWLAKDVRNVVVNRTNPHTHAERDKSTYPAHMFWGEGTDNQPATSKQIWQIQIMIKCCGMCNRNSIMWPWVQDWTSGGRGSMVWVENTDARARHRVTGVFTWTLQQG